MVTGTVSAVVENTTLLVLGPELVAVSVTPPDPLSVPRMIVAPPVPANVVIPKIALFDESVETSVRSWPDPSVPAMKAVFAGPRMSAEPACVPVNEINPLEARLCSTPANAAVAPNVHVFPGVDWSWTDVMFPEPIWKMLPLVQTSRLRSVPPLSLPDMTVALLLKLRSPIAEGDAPKRICLLVQSA